mmetsp:Transcript_9920/g.27107  ORF Transcript_9920/g.27107 Transcript_9920/m.27107 type:complete len:333 (-) Transcript_9920:192-1190(-)
MELIQRRWRDRTILCVALAIGVCGGWHSHLMLRESGIAESVQQRPQVVDHVMTQNDRPSATSDNTTIHIYHLINLYSVPSDPTYHPFNKAQNVTIASMLRAKQHAHRHIVVHLVAAIFVNDTAASNVAFDAILPLHKSYHKLPFLQEMFDALRQYMPQDPTALIVFTNSDIGLHRDFYNFIADVPHASFTINRRIVPAKLTDLDQIEERIPQGGYHPGKDCFVMRQHIDVQFGDLFVGHPPWGRTIDLQLHRAGHGHVNLNSGTNMTFHLGDNGAWKRKTNLIDIHSKEREAMRECTCIPWKLEEMRSMTQEGYQNIVNCANIFRSLGWDKQ